MPNWANGYSTTIVGTISSGATSVSVASVVGIPTTPFKATIAAEGANTAEIVTVTNNVAGTFTITRASELLAGNGASSHSAGATIAAVVTAGDLASIITPGAFPTIVETVAFAANGSSTPTVSLSGTPNTGDVILYAGFGNQYQVNAVTGAGVTKWYPIALIGDTTGSQSPTSLWFGVVGGSPSKNVFPVLEGHNVDYSALVNFRGLTGKMEAQVSTNHLGGSGSPTRSAGALQTLGAPLGIVFFWCRATGAVTEQSGVLTSLTNSTAGGSGWAGLWYQDISAGGLFYPYFSPINDTYNIICVLLK